MSSPGSITGLFSQLQQGDQATTQALWQRYFHRLVGLARKKLGNLPRGAADEEDVALSAFDSFCRAVEQGRFPRLEDRDDLWQLLVLITARKACDLRQYESRDKRDWRRLQDEAGQVGLDSGESLAILSGLFSREPDPSFAAEVGDQCRALLEGLTDDELRQIALQKMEGYTNEEIASRQSCALSTVERRLRLIRRRWEKELPAEQA
jgi:DNA-directed RNA polymerase specialized sigma24 family protein